MQALIPALILSASILLAQAPKPAPPVSAFENLSKQAAALRDSGKLDDAETAYQKALKLRPAWDEGWWNLGSIAYDRDQFPECSAAFQRLTALQPEVAPAWIMLGLCEYGLHNYTATRGALLRAEQLKFDAPPELAKTARLHLALALTKTGVFEKAIVTLTELTRMDRLTPQISVAEGIAGLRKQWLPPEVPEADREMVAKVGEAMGAAMELDPKNATAKFEELVAAYPAQPDIHFRFGAFLMQQSPERGIGEIKKALELVPSHIPALVGLAAIYLKNGDAAASTQFAERAVQADPGDFATHVALGRALLESGDLARAADQLTVAVKLAPDSADAHFSLASAYSRLGRKDDAKREQDEFRKLRKQIDGAH